MNKNKTLRKIAKAKDKSYTIHQWSKYTDHFVQRIITVFKTSKKNKETFEATKKKLMNAIEHLASTCTI